MGLKTIPAREAQACEHKRRTDMSFTNGNAADDKLTRMALTFNYVPANFDSIVGNTSSINWHKVLR